jgi:hypothetical protein
MSASSGSSSPPLEAASNSPSYLTTTTVALTVFSLILLPALFVKPGPMVQWLQRKRYQYEVTFSLYMLTPTEKFIFSEYMLMPEECMLIDARLAAFPISLHDLHCRFAVPPGTPCQNCWQSLLLCEWRVASLPWDPTLPRNGYADHILCKASNGVRRCIIVSLNVNGSMDTFAARRTGFSPQAFMYY